MVVMTEVFNKLKELQDVLSQKYDVEQQIHEAPKKLSSQEELLSRLKKEFIEKNEQYETLRTKVSSLRTQLADAQASRERGEKGMDSISTHREYEALEKEIKDATELEQTVRRELQKEEKIFTDLDESLKNDEQLIEQQETELNQSKDSLNEEVAKLKAEFDSLQKAEEDIIPGIDPEIIFKFERIIKSKHSRGIVAVKGNVCDGCHMILPAQFANEVRTGEKIVFCPYCSRILFYQELESGETEFFHIDDAGSLADLDDEFDDEEDEEEEETQDRPTTDVREELKDINFED